MESLQVQVVDHDRPQDREEKVIDSDRAMEDVPDEVMDHDSIIVGETTISSDEKDVQSPLLEAGRVYLIMKREYRISRNIRAKWYFDHINSVITVPDIRNLDDLTGELEVVSATPRDPTAHCRQGDRFTIVAGSIVTFLSWRYRLVFALDLGHSAASVDVDTGLVFIDKAFQALKNTLLGLTQPFVIPGSKFLFTPELYVTVIAYTPIVCCQLHQVLIQGFTLTATNVDDFLDQIQHQLEQFENYISAALSGVDSNDSDDEDDQYGIGCLFDDQGRPDTPEKTVKTLTPDAGFVNMLRYSILALQLLPENTSAGVVVITDGMIGLPHMSVLDGLLTQLRSSTIACSFVYVGNNCQNNQGLGQVPYVELMQLMATATFGAYLSHAPYVPRPRNDMNIYHKALLLWSFQKGLQHIKIDDFKNIVTDDFRDDHVWRHRSQILPGGGQQICDSPLLRKRHAEYTHNASLFSLLSVRLREGYTIKEVAVQKNETQIEVKLVLPWSHDVWIEYVSTSSWPFSSSKRSTHVQVFMAGTYEFLHDVTCHQTQFKSSYRTMVVSKFQASVCGLSETDRLLVHLQSFLTSVHNYTIAEDIQEKMPLFYLPPQPQSVLLHSQMGFNPASLLQAPSVHLKVQLTMQQSRRDPAFLSFANYWKPIMLLNVNIWQKWMHAHRIGLLLESDQPLPKYLHVPNNSGRFNSVQCRQALMVLNTYLKDYSTFVLMENHSYVKFLYSESEKEKEKTPTSFFLIRVSSTPPCMVLRLAFMVGTQGYVRNKIVNEIRDQMSKLTLHLRGLNDDKSKARRSSHPVTDDGRQGAHKTPRHWSEINCCVLLTKPLEKMLIRYERKPRDFMTLEMDQLPSNQSYGNLGNGASKESFSMFTALTRYQHRQRWVWSVQNGSSMSISMAAVGRVLNTIAKIRLQEGYHFAHSSGGVINMVAEMEMMIAQPSEGNETTAESDIHNCVVQYILFPPHVATQRQESLSEDDLLDDGALETTEADSELQIVSECWIEPQYGLVINSPAERRYLDGLRYPDIPLASRIGMENSGSPSSVPQQSVATPQNPDGCPEVTESAVQYIPYTFNIIGTLGKCQQAEILLSTFVQEAGHKSNPLSPRDRSSVSSDHQTSPNTILFDFLLEKLSETHDKEVYLSDLECGQFLSHVTGRPRRDNAPTLPFKTPLDLSHNLEAETENQELEAEKVTFTPSRQVSAISGGSTTSFLSHVRTSSTMSLSRMVLEKQPFMVNDSIASPQSYIPEPDLDQPPADDVFPRWRCFVRQPAEHRLTLTFIPASYADLETLMQCYDEGDEYETKHNVDESFDLKVRETLFKNVSEGLFLRRSKFWGSSTDTDEDLTIEATTVVAEPTQTDDSVVFEGSVVGTGATTSVTTDKSVNATPSSNLERGPDSPDSFSCGMKPVPKMVIESPEKPKVRKRTLLLPVYCYNASLARITEELESLNHDIVTEEDTYHDFSFRSEKVRSHRSSMADNLHGLGGQEATERDNGDDSQEDEQEFSLEQHCSAMFDAHYRCFVTAAYRSLQRDLVIGKRDFELAIDIVCHELRPVEIDITKFVETVCGHIRNHVDRANMEAAAKKDEYFLVLPKIVPESPNSDTNLPSPTDSSTSQPRSPSSMTTTIRLPLSVFQSSRPCLDVKSLHALIQRKFNAIVGHYFRHVPCCPEYMYFCPMQARQSSVIDGPALNDTTEADQSYAALTTEESDPGAEDEDEAGYPLNQSHYGSEHSLADDAFFQQMEDGIHPLFVQLFCSPALRSKTGILTSIPVETLPTCLHELPRFREDVCQDLNEIELGEFQLTLEIICLTPSSDGEGSRERWLSGGTGSPFPNDLAEAEQDELMNMLPDGNDGTQLLVELPKSQRDAVIGMVEQIEWMLRDEIASALHLMQPVTRDMLELVATHVIDGKEQVNCMNEDINLKFVYGTEPSTIKFVEEFEKMKLPGYRLSKEGDYYYVVMDRMPSPSFRHIEPTLTNRMYGPPRFPAPSHDAVTNEGSHALLVGQKNGVVSPHTDDSNEKSDDVPGISLTRPSPAKERMAPFSVSEGAFQILDESSEQSAQILRKLSAQRRSSVPEADDSKPVEEPRRASFQLEDVSLPTSEAPPSRDINPPVLAKSKLSKLKLTCQSLEKVTSPSSDSPRSRHSSGDEIRRILHGGHSGEIAGRRSTSSPVHGSPDKLKDISEIGNEISLRQSRSRHSSGPRRHHSGGSQTSSINPSRCQTPRGGSHIDISGRVSYTDQGYEGDSSDSEGEEPGGSSLAASMNFNVVQPLTFWIIMRLHGDHVRMYFHTRPCEEGDESEFLQHKFLFRQIATKINSACKIVNQMLLLESLYDTRMCNFLLVPEADEDIVWKDDHQYQPNPGKQESDEDEPPQSAYLSAYQEFKPGHFACQCVWKHKFSLHPRLKTGPGRSVVSRGIQALRGVMLEFSVNNRKNMFVVKETSGAVFYLRLHESMTELRNAGLDGDLAESRSSSLLSLPVVRRASEYEDDVSIKQTREQQDDVVSLSSRSNSKRSEECLVLSVHGITQPGEEVKVKLTQMLQNKLDESVLDLISVMLARNPMCKLMAQDVQFIQRPDLSPEASYCYTIPSAALLHLMALRQYIRQNLLQFLHTPKYIDASPETHFQDNSQSLPVELSEHDVFLYNRPQSSGGKGIACIHVCFVDGRGNPVQLLTCPLPRYDAHQEALDTPASFETMTNSCHYGTNDDDTSRPGPTALVRVRIWERGNVDIKLLVDKVHQALRHATCDVIMEYKLFTAPICSIPHQQNRLTETSAVNLSAPSSPVKVPKVVPQSAGPSDVKPTFPQPAKKVPADETQNAAGKSSSNLNLLSEKLESLAGKSNSNDTDVVRKSREEIWKRTIQRYECGEDGILSNVYSSSLTEWFNFCVENGVPSLNRSSYLIQSRLSVETILKECQTVIKSLCDDTDLKIFKKVAGKEQSSIYIPQVPCNHETRTAEDESRPERTGPSAPGQINLYICLARNVKQWRGCTDNPYLPDDPVSVLNLVNTKTHKSVQRFLPFDSERSRESVTSQSSMPAERERDHIYIPRQRLLVMYVEDRKLTTYAYNWSVDLYANLEHSLKRLILWHNARYDAVCSTVLQKMGLFQHRRFDDLSAQPGASNPFNKMPECIDLLVRHATPAMRDFQTRASAVASRALDHHHHNRSLVNFDDILLYSRPHKPLQSKHTGPNFDPIKQHGVQAIEVHHNHCKECDRQKLLDDLYRMWQQKAGRTAIPADELDFLMSQCELFHYMMAPVLFCPKSRQALLRPKQRHAPSPVVPQVVKETKRSRHVSSGSAIKEKVVVADKPRPQASSVSSTETPRVEESWPNTLIQQYVQYIQSWGFILVHTTAPSPSRRAFRARGHSGTLDPSTRPRARSDDRPASSSRVHLQRTIPGGIIIVQISLQEALFCVRLYAYHCEDRCIDTLGADPSGSQFQTRRYFYDECEKYKDMIHVNSFTYDFHLRMIQSYIDGRQLVFKSNYHLTGFLRDFILMYPYPPNHARNYVYAGQITATNQSTSAAELYDYMLKHDKRYEMKAIKMSPHVEMDADLESFYYLREHEYALVCLSHESLQESTSDLFMQQKRDDYDVGLVLSHSKRESLSSVSDLSSADDNNTLVLSYYIILTSKREPFPKLQLEKQLTMQQNPNPGVYRARHPLHTMMAQDPLSFLQSSPPNHTDSPTNTSVSLSPSHHRSFLSTNHGVARSPGARRTLLLTNDESERDGGAEASSNRGFRSFSCGGGRRSPPYQSRDLVNYLGYSSGHQLPLFTLMVKKVQSIREKIDQMVTNAMSQCRRDLLWQRMLCSCSSEEEGRRKKRSDTDESRERLSQKLTLAEFIELLASVPRRSLSSIDPRLMPLQSQKASWYGGLVGVLQAKYPETSRMYSSSDNSRQFVVVLNPNYLDTFMLMDIDVGNSRAELCAVYRETIPTDDHSQPPSLVQSQLQSHMEGFVNACCYHMWCSLVLGEK